MSRMTTGLWIVAVIAAFAIGWYAATEVGRGPAFKGEQDAYERFSNAFTIDDSLERVELVARLVRRLTPETLPGAIRALKDDLEDVYNHDLRTVMYYWAQQDPQGMLREVQGWPEVRAQRMAAGEAVYWVLKKEGYDRARALFDQLPSHQRDPALAHLVLAYLESGETPDLIGLIDQHDMPEERHFVAGIVVGQILAANGPDALARWVESLPGGPGTSSDLKVVAFEAAQSELMRRDQFEFLDGWIDRIGDAPWARSGGRRTIGIHLVKRDPMRAIAYAESLPPEKGRARVLDATLRAYASHDRDGALAWMRSVEPDERLDVGTARLVYEFALRDSGAALEMLGRIQDPDTLARAKKVMIDHIRVLPEESRAIIAARVEAISAPASPPAGKAEPAGAPGSPAADGS